MNKENWFKKFLDRRFELKKIKTNKKEYYSAKRFWLGIIFSCILFLSVLIISFTVLSQTISNSISEVLKSNPEYAFLNDCNSKKELCVGTLLKQVMFDGNIQGEFYGEFDVRNDRHLEKKDLTCVEEYTYQSFENINLVASEQLKDDECTPFGEKKNITYYKCPKRNCKKIEIKREILDSFIPRTIRISNVNLKTTNTPKGDIQ